MASREAVKIGNNNRSIAKQEGGEVGMRCDKCRKRFVDTWVAGESYPKYGIEEITGIGERAPINLCYECSQLFKEWLSEEPEEDEGFGR